MSVKIQFQQQSKVIEGNFFNLYFGNFNSDNKFEGSDCKNSFMMLLSLETICTMIWKCLIVYEPRYVWIHWLVNINKKNAFYLLGI